MSDASSMSSQEVDRRNAWSKQTVNYTSSPSRSQSLLSEDTAMTSSPSADQRSISSEDEFCQFSGSDIIVAVMGPTGAGKSSFINMATGVSRNTVGHSLRSCTRDVRAVSCSHPDSGRKVVFVDTPGFDDTEMADTDILEAIANWLTSTYKRKITLTGLLFLHRISDNRMAGTPLRNLSMFRKLCGTTALENVILITTMWDEVDAETGSSREEELRNKYWKPMIIAGSRISRFAYTRESAWEIVDQFTGTRHALQLQVEMVDQGLALPQTEAGSTLFQWLERLVADFREMIRKIEARLRGISKDNDPAAAAAAMQERTDAERRFSQANEQKQKLRLRRSRSLVKKVLRRSSTTIDSRSESAPPPPPPPPLPPLPITGSTTFSVARRRKSEKGKNRGKALTATILALRHAWHVADIASVPFLRGAVGLALEIAESVDALKSAEHSLVLLAQDAGGLIVAITEQVNVGEIPDDVRQTVERFIKELQGVQNVITDISSRSLASRCLHPADERVVSACSDSIKLACDLFGIRLAIINQQAVARIETQLRLLQEHQCRRESSSTSAGKLSYHNSEPQAGRAC